MRSGTSIACLPRVPTLPIHTLEVIGEAGASVHLSVFCSRKRASTAVSVCRECPHFDADSSAGVTCDAPPRSADTPSSGRAGLLTGADALTTNVCAGDLLGLRTIAVRDAACTASLTEAELHAAPAVVVIDACGHPVQMRVRRDGFEARSLRESATLDEALHLMIHHHVRYVPLVDSDGALVGLLTDLDVLRWVATIKREKRI